MRTVIFNVMHYGMILDIVNYRYVYHSKDNCILLLSGYWTNPRNIFIDNLEKNGIFNKILYYDCSQLYVCDDKEQLIDKINDHFHLIEKELGVNFNNTINYTYPEIDDAFSIFSILNDIVVNYLRPYHLTEYLLKASYEELYRQGLVSEAFYMLQKETMALGSMDNQIEFNFLDTLKKLSFTTKRKILKCAKGYDIPDKRTSLLLTNSINLMAGAGIKENEVPFVYQLLLDYYVPSDEKVMIKPHPHSPDYNICFDSSMLISRDINIEILRYGRNKLKRTYSVCSTSSSKLKGIAKDTIELGHGFFQHHLIIPVINDLVCTFGNTDFNFYQDFMNDYSFVKVLANYKGVNFEMKTLPIPDGNLRHSIVFSDCVGHTGNMNDDSEYSVFLLGKLDKIEQKTKYCMQIEYRNEYMGGYLTNNVTVFTNDKEIIDRMAREDRINLPFSRNLYTKRVIQK